MQQKKPDVGIKKFLPGIAWFLFVLLLLCLPGESISDTSWIDIVNFDKLVHAGLFGGIVFWFCMPFKNSPMPRQDKLNLFIRITLATIIWGITSEYIQKYFIHGRDFDLFDWAADSTGASIAFFVSRRYFL